MCRWEREQSYETGFYNCVIYDSYTLLQYIITCLFKDARQIFSFLSLKQFSRSVVQCLTLYYLHFSLPQLKWFGNLS